MRRNIDKVLNRVNKRFARFRKHFKQARANKNSGALKALVKELTKYKSELSQDKTVVIDNFKVFALELEELAKSAQQSAQNLDKPKVSGVRGK